MMSALYWKQTPWVGSSWR